MRGIIQIAWNDSGKIIDYGNVKSEATRVLCAELGWREDELKALPIPD